MANLIGTSDRPIVPLWFGEDNYRYLTQLSEDGISLRIYDNKKKNKFLGSISLREIALMENKFVEGNCCPHGYEDWDDCPNCGH